MSELGYPSFTVEDFHENVRDILHHAWLQVREVHSFLTTLLSQFMEVVDSLETEGMTVTELLKVRLVPHCPKRSSDGHQLDHFNCSFVAPVSQ